MIVSRNMSNVFRVFISSTFNDLKVERDALQERVFPKLRMMCQHYGYRFQAIDLRWGISDEAGRQQRTMGICLEEIERCQKLSPKPNFLILLGDRYGWRPLPESLSAEKFHRIKTLIEPTMAELLHKAYLLDKNSVPPCYVLRERHDHWQNEIEIPLIDELKRLQGLGRVSDCLSATHHEIRLGALEVANAQKHIFGFFRQFQNIDDIKKYPNAAIKYLDRDKNQWDEESKAALSDLCQELKSKLGNKVTEYPLFWTPDEGEINDYLGNPGEYPKCLDLLGKDIPPKGQYLCIDVFRSLATVILREIQSREGKQEEDIQVNFAKEACLQQDDSSQKSYHNNSLYLRRKSNQTVIDDFIFQGNSANTLVLYGPPGVGKSALAARTALDLSGSESGWAVVQRYVGADTMTATGEGLLASVNAAIAALSNGKPIVCAGGFNALVETFRSLIDVFPQSKRILIVIDGLDILPEEDPLRNLSWMPAKLSKNIRLLISTDRPNLQSGCPLTTDCFYEIKSLTATETETLLKAWFNSVGRCLTKKQKNAVLTVAKKDGLPLSLRIAFLISRQWSHFDPVPNFGSGLHGLLKHWIDVNQRDENHGPVMVKEFLGLLACSRNGLTEDEILDLLSSSKNKTLVDFKRRSTNSPKIDRLPAAPWIRLYGDCGPLLRTQSSFGHATLGFAHPLIADIIIKLCFSRKQLRRFHRYLADYFSYSRKTEKDTVQMERQLAEQAYQLDGAGHLRQLTNLLFSPDFLEERIRRHGIFNLLSDFTLSSVRVLMQEPEPGIGYDLKNIKTALLQASRALLDNPQELTAQLHWRLSNASTHRIDKLIEDLRKRKREPWFRISKINDTPEIHSTDFLLEGHTAEIHTLASAACGNLVSASHDHTVRFWDIERKRELPGRIMLPDDRLVGMVLSPCSRYVLTAARNGRVRIFSMNGSELTANPVWIKSVILGITVNNTHLFLLTKRSELLAWRMKNGNDWQPDNLSPVPDAQYAFPSKWDIRLIAPACGGQRILLGGRDGLFSIAFNGTIFFDPRCLKKAAADFHVSCLSGQDCGQFIFVGCADGTVWGNILDKDQPLKWSCLGKINGSSTEPVCAITPTLDTTRVFAGNYKGMIREFSMDGTTLNNGISSPLKIGTQIRSLVTLQCDHGKMLLARAGKTRVIEVITTKPFKSAYSLDAGINTLTTSLNGNWGAGGDSNGTITIYDLNRTEAFFSLNSRFSSISCLAFSPDGNYLVAGSMDSKGGIALISMDHPQSGILYSQPRDGSIRGVLWISSKNRILTINEFDEVVIFMLPDLREEAVFSSIGFHDHAVCSAATIRIDDKIFLFSGSACGHVDMRLVENFMPIHNEQLTNNKPIRVVVPVNNGHVLVGTDAGELILYKLSEHIFSETTRFEHPAPVTGAVADGRGWFVSSCLDGRLRLWHKRATKPIATLTMDDAICACAGQPAQCIIAGNRLAQIFYIRVQFLDTNSEKISNIAINIKTQK